MKIHSLLSRFKSKTREALLPNIREILDIANPFPWIDVTLISLLRSKEFKRYYLHYPIENHQFTARALYGLSVKRWPFNYVQCNKLMKQWFHHAFLFVITMAVLFGYTFYSMIRDLFRKGGENNEG